MISGLIGLDAAGIYAASYGLISQPFLMAGIVLENYYRPHYYDALADDESDNARRILTTWFVLTAVVCALGLIAVIALKSLIVSLFLAESYRSAAGLLFPIALGNAFFALSQVSERFLHGQERTGPLPGQPDDRRGHESRRRSTDDLSTTGSRERPGPSRFTMDVSSRVPCSSFAGLRASRSRDHFSWVRMHDEFASQSEEF